MALDYVVSKKKKDIKKKEKRQIINVINNTWKIKIEIKNDMKEKVSIYLIFFFFFLWWKQEKKTQEIETAYKHNGTYVGQNDINNKWRNNKKIQNLSSIDWVNRQFSPRDCTHFVY